MVVGEQEIRAIIQEVVAKLKTEEANSGSLGVFEDMNEAIKASIEAQKVMHSLSMDSREKIIQNIKKITFEKL